VMAHTIDRNETGRKAMTSFKTDLMTGSGVTTVPPVRIFYLIFVAMTTVFMSACDVGTDEREGQPRLSVEAARPIWFNALRSALSTKLDAYSDYIILHEPFLGQITLVKRDNVIIQCDPLLGVEIMGFMYGEDVPAVTLGLIGTVAELDDPEYSVPDLLEDNDDPAVMNLMKDLCVEVANALDGV
jgi:hypothetical protein